LSDPAAPSSRAQPHTTRARANRTGRAARGQVLQILATSVDRGACIRDLSQYPGEVLLRASRARVHSRNLVRAYVRACRIGCD
jgi:hypothetical protein